MLAIKWHHTNQLASELLSYRRQSTWQWQTLNTGRKSARYIRRAVMEYQREYPFGCKLIPKTTFKRGYNE